MLARYAEGDEVAYYTYLGAEGGGWLDDDGVYHVRLFRGVASRAAVFHEWLHRSRRSRQIDIEPQAAEEAFIGAFLARFGKLFGMAHE